MYDNYNSTGIRSHTHSHPESTTGPTGYHPNHNRSDDKEFAIWSNTRLPRTLLYVYEVKTKMYIQYDKNGIIKKSTRR